MKNPKKPNRTWSSKKNYISLLVNVTDLENLESIQLSEDALTKRVKIFTVLESYVIIKV